MPDVKIKEEKTMIINSNLAAMNTIRQLGINEQATQSSLAKLSSGLRINSAADDAAGLSISEKMRGQISGLNTASSNAQTGINLAATAEGALNTSTSILQRMRELAVQGANGTNTTSDNTAMSDEFDQLKSALDDIGNQTQFNTKNLLDGSQAGAVGASVGQNATTGAVAGKLSAAIATGTGAFAAGGVTAANFVAETENIDGTNINVNWQNLSTVDQATITAGTAAGASTTAQNSAVNLIVNTINTAIDQSGSNVAHVSGYVTGGGSLSIQSGSAGINSAVKGDITAASGVLEAAQGSAVTATGADLYSGTTVAAGASFNININGIQMQVATSAASAFTSGATSLGVVAGVMQNDINAAITTYDTNAGVSAGQTGFINAVNVNATNDGRLQVLSQSGPVSFSDLAGKTTTSDLGLNTAQTSSSSGGGLTFQIGANAGQTLSFGIDDMRSAALGLSSVNVDSQASAENAITAIDAATAKVSAERSKLGAIQNRLTDTISNLGTSSQNITSAEADIRDVDMASEMTNFQKNNVLQQAATSMLAQANQQPQNVLKLLQ